MEKIPELLILEKAAESLSILFEGLNAMGDVFHIISKQHGFWPLDEHGNANVNQRNFGEMIALMHSELSEALEHHRKGTMDDHLPNHVGWHVELADALIRILETARAHQVPIGQIVYEKMMFNHRRPYKHGKSY